MAAFILPVGMALALWLAVPADVAFAQELNKRTHAPPNASAKKARVLTGARSEAAKNNNANLNSSTVNTDCSPVEIGNQDLSDTDRLSRDEQVVVVPGDIINICR